MSRVTRAGSDKGKDVRAQESHSQDQSGTQVMMDTNNDEEALVNEDVDNAEAISARGQGTIPQ